MTESDPIQSPVVVGVIGGIASGKSQVTRMLGEMDAVIISADEIAHRVLEESHVIRSLANVFGDSILTQRSDLADAPRTIDRKSLASIVFGDSMDSRTMRKKLEAIVHPRIREIARSQLETLKKEAKTRFVVLDVPLLIEGGWLPYCDRVVFVDAQDAHRRQRALDRGWTVEDWQNRESAQISLSEKKMHATDILVNDGTLEQLAQKVLKLTASWQ